MVSMATIILHDVPQNRMIADRNHWLWNIVRVIANSCTQSATK